MHFNILNVDLPQHALLLCKNKWGPFIVGSMKLAEQAWNSRMTQDDSLKGVLVPKQLPAWEQWT